MSEEAVGGRVFFSSTGRSLVDEDEIVVLSVGVDIGSSTSHLMFSLVHLQRLGTALSSRFVVVKRQVMWESPIKLTPYLPDYTIDTDDLAEFFGSCYHLAQVDPDDVEMLQDLVVTAVRDALKKAQDHHSEKMGAIMGGLPKIPGLNF